MARRPTELTYPTPLDKFTIPWKHSLAAAPPASDKLPHKRGRHAEGFGPIGWHGCCRGPLALVLGRVGSSGGRAEAHGCAGANLDGRARQVRALADLLRTLSASAADGRTGQAQTPVAELQNGGGGEDWTAPEFDDGTWFKGPATLATKTALAARVCLRGKFMVTDPAAVEGLSLRADYRGGLVVYVNGKEVKREHIAAGAALADGPVGEERSLEALAISGSLLRKGLNVVALEVVRLPVPAPAAFYAENSCEIVGVRCRPLSPRGWFRTPSARKAFRSGTWTVWRWTSTWIGAIAASPCAR